MTRQIAFLITPKAVSADPDNDNAQRIPAAFALAGWRCHSAAHDDMRWQDGQLSIGAMPAAHFDLIWPVGFGPQATFFDRLQLATGTSPDRFITHPSAYLALHGKAALLEHGPECFIASSAAAIGHHLERHPGDWVLKPLAGSFGRNVVRVRWSDDVDRALASAPPGYWVLQRFVPAIAAGETRTLICGDEIIGSYLRVPVDTLHANLAAGADPKPTELSAADRAVTARVHEQLQHAGVGFAAIDTVDGLLMEVNIANPGGLGTLDNLYRRDHGAALVHAAERLVALRGAA